MVIDTSAEKTADLDIQEGDLTSPKDFLVSLRHEIPQISFNRSASKNAESTEFLDSLGQEAYQLAQVHLERWQRLSPAFDLRLVNHDKNADYYVHNFVLVSRFLGTAAMRLQNIGDPRFKNYLDDPKLRTGLLRENAVEFRRIAWMLRDDKGDLSPTTWQSVRPYAHSPEEVKAFVEKYKDLGLVFVKFALERQTKEPEKFLKNSRRKIRELSRDKDNQDIGITGIKRAVLRYRKRSKAHAKKSSKLFEKLMDDPTNARLGKRIIRLAVNRYIKSPTPEVYLQAVKDAINLFGNYSEYPEFMILPRTTFKNIIADNISEPESKLRQKAANYSHLLSHQAYKILGPYIIRASIEKNSNSPYHTLNRAVKQYEQFSSHGEIEVLGKAVMTFAIIKYGKRAESFLNDGVELYQKLSKDKRWAPFGPDAVRLAIIVQPENFDVYVDDLWRVYQDFRKDRRFHSYPAITLQHEIGRRPTITSDELYELLEKQYIWEPQSQ